MSENATNEQEQSADKKPTSREEEYKDAVMQDLYNDISSSDDEDSGEEKESAIKKETTQLID